MDIDLNADLGEGYGDWRMTDDEALMDVVTSANVACGWHAGDPVIMDRTVRLALAKGVDLGAHVGFPDLLGFGRRRIDADPLDVAKYVLYQLGALSAFARVAGHRVTHLSFHGALGNMAAADYALAEPLVRAVGEFDPSIVISVSTDTQIERAADKVGLRVANTFLADRAYDDAGALVSRKLPGAVIHDSAQVLERVIRLLDDGAITSITGRKLPVKVQQILVHGDTPTAVASARAIRQAIEAGGAARVVPISRLLV